MQPGATPGAILSAPLATMVTMEVTKTCGKCGVVYPATAETAALTLQRQSYELEAVLADGDTVTLATGTLTVERDIPAV